MGFQLRDITFLHLQDPSLPWTTNEPPDGLQMVASRTVTIAINAVQEALSVNSMLGDVETNWHCVQWSGYRYYSRPADQIASLLAFLHQL